MLIRPYFRVALLLAMVGLLVCTVAWGDCLAPWKVTCFTSGSWGDYKFHYHGWISYLRGNSWIPPYISSFTWPHKSSAMFTDSIPIAAVIFKPVTLALRIPDWQYFSILSIANSLIIAWCSARIGQVLRWKIITTVCLGVLLLTSSLSWTRLIVHHEALQLHSILILAITWIITRQSSFKDWIFLMAVSVGIHAYYIPMVLGAFCCYLATSRHRLLKLIILVCVAILSALIFGFLPGSMSSGSDVWGANLLSLLDPQNHSTIFSALAKSEPYETEGYAYLGMGVIAGLFIVFARNDLSDSQLEIFPRSWWFISILLFIFALGHTWNVADTPITPHKLTYVVPGVSKIYDVFRSSGRYAWPISYSIVLWVFHNLDRASRSSVLIPILVLVQLLDSNLKSIYRVNTHLSNILLSGVTAVEWSSSNKMYATQITNADTFVVGRVSNRSLLPPLYVPQYLNPSLKSNWGGVLARNPKASKQRSALEHWISLLPNYENISPVGSINQSGNFYTLIVTDDKSEINALLEAVKIRGMTYQIVAPYVFKVPVAL